jgi:DnaK suppressor protein
MDFIVQRKCLETRLNALSSGMLAGQGLSAFARDGVTIDDEVNLLTRQSKMTSLMGREVKAILTALDRMEAGEYGYCRICGADISSEHLSAHPESPFCEFCSA